MEEKLTESGIQIYKRGFIDGMTTFAHWKDGTQYVGTCGKTLKKAIEEVEDLFNFKPRIYLEPIE